MNKPQYEHQKPIYILQCALMGKRKFKLSVLRKNYERKKYAKKSLSVSIPLSILPSDKLRPLTTNTTAVSHECGSIDELRGVLAGATNAIPVEWSLVQDDNHSRLILVKLSAQEVEETGAKITYSLTVQSDFTYTVHVRGKLLDPSKTTVLQNLNTTVSTLSGMTMIMETLDSFVVCSGNSNKKYHSLRGWTKGSFLDRIGELFTLAILAYTQHLHTAYIHVKMYKQLF